MKNRDTHGHQGAEDGRSFNRTPPIIASTHTVDYTCGYCDTVLLHADEGQVYGLTIRCGGCGSYNKTEE